MKLGYNEEIIWNQAYILNEKRKNNEVVAGTVEILGTRFELDPMRPYLDFPGVKHTNLEYCKAELDWYLSENLNVDVIEQHAKLWSKIKSRDGNVNSNYGYLLYHDSNDNQYHHAVNMLMNNKDSRQSCCIYNRPSMQLEWNQNGMRDFICTFATSHFIRDNRLVYIVNMRSNDLIYGFFNDFFWHCYIYDKMLTELSVAYPDLRPGKMIWMANSLHVYERHFLLLDKIASIKFQEKA